MQLFRLLKILVTATVFCLVYIHMQMQIFELAYQGKKKANTIAALMEENSMVKTDILEMKSSKSLGVKLLGDQASMQFRDESNVIQLVTRPSPEPLTDQVALSPSPRRENPLLSLISFGSQAEAKTLDNSRSTRWLRDR